MALRALSFTPDAALMDDKLAKERSKHKSGCSCAEAASELQATLTPATQNVCRRVPAVRAPAGAPGARLAI